MSEYYDGKKWWDWTALPTALHSAAFVFLSDDDGFLLGGVDATGAEVDTVYHVIYLK